MRKDNEEKSKSRMEQKESREMEKIFACAPENAKLGNEELKRQKAMKE
jgi:hypothetical protein